MWKVVGCTDHMRTLPWQVYPEMAPRGMFCGLRISTKLRGGRGSLRQGGHGKQDPLRGCCFPSVGPQPSCSAALAYLACPTGWRTPCTLFASRMAYTHCVLSLPTGPSRLHIAQPRSPSSSFPLTDGSEAFGTQPTIPGQFYDHVRVRNGTFFRWVSNGPHPPARRCAEPGPAPVVRSPRPVSPDMQPILIHYPHANPPSGAGVVYRPAAVHGRVHVCPRGGGGGGRDPTPQEGRATHGKPLWVPTAIGPP